MKPMLAVALTLITLSTSAAPLTANFVRVQSSVSLFSLADFAYVDTDVYHVVAYNPNPSDLTFFRLDISAPLFDSGVGVKQGTDLIAFSDTPFGSGLFADSFIAMNENAPPGAITYSGLTDTSTRLSADATIFSVDPTNGNQHVPHEDRIAVPAGGFGVLAVLSVPVGTEFELEQVGVAVFPPGVPEDILFAGVIVPEPTAAMMTCALLSCFADRGRARS